MSGPFANIARCLDLQERDVAEAVDTREATKALIEHLAAVSAPNTGAAKVLIVFARLATTACNWIDGDLCIELVGDADVTVVEAATELGGGLRERLFAPLPFVAPFVEFARAIERVPHMIAPLAIRAHSRGRISLAATEAVRMTTFPPPPVQISADSLFVRMSPLIAPRGMNEAASTASLPVITATRAGDVRASEAPAEQGSSEPPLNDFDSAWDK